MFLKNLLGEKMKNTLFLLMLAIILISCGKTDNPKQKADTDTQTKQDIVDIQLPQFKDKAPELVGKEIVFTGLVDHTCKHSGKRMFLVDKNSDAHLKVEAGKNIKRFDAKLTGNIVKVVGLVKEKKIDLKYLNDWKKDVMNKIEGNKELHLGTHEKGMEQKNEMDETLSHIKKMKKELKESGKEHLSFYSVECVSFKVLNLDKK